MFGNRKDVDMDESGIIYEEDLIPAMRSKIAELEKENADFKKEKEAKQKAEEKRKLRLVNGLTRSAVYVLTALMVFWMFLVFYACKNQEAEDNIAKTKSNFASLQPTASLEELKKFEGWNVLHLYSPENQVVEICNDDRGNGPKKYIHLDPEIYEAVKRMGKIDTFFLASFFEKKKQRTEIASEIFSGELSKATKDLERLRDEHALMSSEIEKLRKENSSLKSELALARAEAEAVKPEKEKPAEIANQVPMLSLGFLEKKCEGESSPSILCVIGSILVFIFFCFSVKQIMSTY